MKSNYIQRARIIKAIAHPSRLMMVEALAKGQLCVCALQRLVGSDMTTVSKHLTVMKKAGLVEANKVGVKVHYKLRVPCILAFLKCIELITPEGKESGCRKCP